MLARIAPIDKLVQEVLDQLPIHVWTDPAIRFLDPAMGGGQFVAEIERRLTKHGYSKENIASRVVGYEYTDALVDLAVNLNRLKGIAMVGNYKKVEYNKLLNMDNSMKFDVIISNPPYQTSNNETGGANSLWRKFISKAFDCCTNDGYVAMVCPGFPVKAKDVRHHFINNTPLVLENSVNHHFPKIGINIKYWIVRKGKHNATFKVDGNVWSCGLDVDPTKDRILTSILLKVNKLNKFECKHDRGYVSSQLKHNPNDYFEHPQGTSIYPIRHASKIKVCYVSKPTACYKLRKVMMTFSGNPNFEYYDETTPMSSCYEMSGYIEVADRKEGESLISLYNTKLYKLLSKGNSAGMKGEDSYCLPKVTLNKTWTDSDVYTHFDLTQEEIDYIEQNA